MDQTTSPIPQLAPDAAKNPQARRVRFSVRKAARPQLTSAMIAATASPMSSTATVASSPPMRSPVQATNATARMAAAVAAIVNARQPLKPKPLTTGANRDSGDKTRLLGDARRKAGAYVGEGDLAITSPIAC